MWQKVFSHIFLTPRCIKIMKMPSEFYMDINFVGYFSLIFCRVYHLVQSPDVPQKKASNQHSVRATCNTLFLKTSLKIRETKFHYLISDPRNFEFYRFLR